MSTRMAICKLLLRNLVLQMPLTLTDYAWQKATLMQKLNFYIAQVPFLKRRILKSIGTNNLYIKCAGLESDRNPDAERKTSIYPVIIDKPDFAKIRQACKAKQVSVYSAIQTAASQAICEMIVEEAIKRRIPVEELTQTSVRAIAAVHRDDVIRNNESFLCTLSYLIPHTIDVSDACDNDTFWQRVEAAHTSVRTGFSAGSAWSKRAGAGCHLTCLRNCRLIMSPRVVCSSRAFRVD